MLSQDLVLVQLRASRALIIGRDVLADALRVETGIRARRVIKTGGETSIEGLTLSGQLRDDKDD
jgi:hypothetical protein